MPPKQSFFLFGPRGTGKSTWLRQNMPDALWVDLLEAGDFRSYSAKPERLKELVLAGSERKTVTLASMSHTKTITTKADVFYIHRIAASFFKGFDWYKGSGKFLIAEPEKALIDCLYISARRKKQFSHFPELRFPKTFSFKKAKDWANQIPDKNIRCCVNKKLEDIIGKIKSVKNHF